MKLSPATVTLLETIENTIDPETEQDLRDQWIRFLNHQSDAPIFHASRKKKNTASYTWQRININDAIEDYEKMLVSQMEGVLGALLSDSSFPAVRSNYGVGILPSLFGAEKFMMPYYTNTLPNVRSVGADAMPRLLDQGMPDLYAGFGRQTLEMGEIFAETFSHYPKIRQFVTVYHPDLQGTLDVAELLLGSSDLFYSMYDEPDELKALLSLITDAYAVFMEKWYEIIPQQPDYNVHWGSLMHRGTIFLRDDSAMNLSPELYREFAMPYDARLLKHFGGGAMHFCGRGDHYMEDLTSIPDLTAIQMSQPELNDMEKIYRLTVDRGLQILSFNGAWAKKDLSRPGGFHGNLNS